MFSIASTPALWQRAMDQIFQGIPVMQCYLDNIIVAGESDEKHLRNVKSELDNHKKFTHHCLSIWHGLHFHIALKLLYHIP